MNFTSALFALAAAMPAAAAAAGTDMQIRQPVHHADLDLRTDLGKRKLDQRIWIAITTACGNASDTDLRGSKQIRRCRAEAKARAALSRDEAIAAASRRVPSHLAAQ